MVRNTWRVLGTFLAGGAIYTWFTRELLKAWFFERVLEFMGPYITIPIGVLVEYIPPASLGCAAIYLLVGEQKRHAINYWVRRNVSPFLVAAGLCAAGTVIALVLYWADRARGPIRWVLNSEGSPLEFSLNSARQPVFAGFRVIGHSRSDEPTPMGKSFIHSNITGQDVKMVVGIPGGNIDSNDATVEPLGTVILFGQFPLGANPTPISIDDFRREFGRFTFHFKYADGRAIEKAYSENEVNNLIEKAVSALQRTQQTAPGVIRNR